MKVIESKHELKKAVTHAKQAGHIIGFVPTMGFLHDGHASLMRRAKEETDIVVTSVFVNPTQFGVGEDLDAYPRDRQKDCERMTAEKVDIAFFPETETMYPKGHTTFVEVQSRMTQVLCGQSRPTHFKGVTTIVTKLLNMVSPDRAYFGQKDAQQVCVVKQMVKDLDFDVQIVACPIVRESDGLAMSSRNAYLSPEQRSKAPILYHSLCAAKVMVEKGERSAAAIIESIEKQIDTIEDVTTDYVSVVDAVTLEGVETLDGPCLIALAVKFGGTRLIDNVRVEVPA